MSATSSEVRTCLAGWHLLSGKEHTKLVERTGHRANGLGCNLGVEGGVLEPGMAEQCLDDPDIGSILEQVGSKAMAQCVRADPLGDPCCLGGLDDNAMELPWNCLVLTGFMVCKPGNIQPSNAAFCSSRQASCPSGRTV